MQNKFNELMAKEGASLCDPISFGKHKGSYLWEVDETYFKYLCKKNAISYELVLQKIAEAKIHRDIMDNRAPRRKVNESNIKEFLFPHQKEFVLKYGDNNYANLWAAIGTGKTYAYLEVVRHKIQAGEKVLILCPKSVFTSWNESILSYLGSDATFVNVTGTAKDKYARLFYNKYLYITNYETLLNPDLLKKLKEIKFSFIIADEAHKYFCNTSTKTYKNAMDLSASIEIKHILTGTPRRNNDLNLYGLVTFLDRGERFGASFPEFKYKYFIPSYNGRNFTLNQSLAEEFWDKIKSCSYVVTNDILNLPDLTESVREIELTGEARKYYEIMRKDAIIEIENYKNDKYNVINASIAIAKITKLRQICSGFIKDTETEETVIFNQDKILELKDLIESSNEPIIITVVYKEEVNQIKTLLESMGLKYGVIAGKINDKNRELARIEFSQNRLDAIILQEQAGGVGINGLQNHCSLMIRYSYGYSFDDDVQVVGRMKRQGQTKNMRMIRFKTILGETKQTVENAIIEAVNNKSDGFDNLVSKLTGNI